MPEYMRARAELEIGSRHWVANGRPAQVSRREAWWLSPRARIAIAVVATMGMAGAALLIAHSVPAAIFTALIVAAALALTGVGDDTSSVPDDDDGGGPDIFTAKFPPPTPPSYDERSTDIVGLEPFSSNGHEDTLVEGHMEGSNEEA